MHDFPIPKLPLGFFSIPEASRTSRVTRLSPLTANLASWPWDMIPTKLGNILI
jgi:hypothetical protein